MTQKWLFFFFSFELKLVFCEKNKDDWKFIAELLKKDFVECVFKYHSMKISNVQRQEWTNEEDKILQFVVRY